MLKGANYKSWFPLVSRVIRPLADIPWCQVASLLQSCRGHLRKRKATLSHTHTHTHTNNTDKMKSVLSTDLEYGAYKIIGGLPRWYNGQESTCQCRRSKRCEFSPWVQRIPWRRKWQPSQVFLPGESHGERSLVGYRPWGRKDSYMTEHAPKQDYGNIFTVKS